MTGTKSGTILLGVLVCPFISTACVKRMERITVAPDGRVTIALEYEAKPGEFERGDAMPSEKNGWRTDKRTKKDEHDGELEVLLAERTFAQGEELPKSYAAADDPHADLYLNFPTTLRREKRRDGDYLHFRRVYAPRAWAYVHYWEDVHFNELLKEIAKKPLEDLTAEERRKVLQAFAGFEADKQIEFARMALDESTPNLPQDSWLRVRARILKAYDELIDWKRIESIYQEISKDDRDQKFAQECERIQREANEILLKSLREDEGFHDDKIARFEQSFARAKKYYEITDLLAGHGFALVVKMPGEVVAHNATGANDEGELLWEFDGKSFRDRPFEIMITSRLPANGDGR